VLSILASKNYIQGRWNIDGLPKRPQAVAWANNFGRIDDGILVPNGVEFEDFIILSDHNRGPIEYTCERIENRVRTINAKMRSYHVADKLQISLSWDNLPSRAFNKNPEIGSVGKPTASSLESYTVDGGAGGADLLKWYSDHPGSFWMYIATDKYHNFATNEYNRMGEYSELIEVYFSSFTHSVLKRGRNTHDFWNVNITLEEV
jgi:hypothetical protein